MRPDIIRGNDDCSAWIEVFKRVNRLYRHDIITYRKRAVEQNRHLVPFIFSANRIDFSQKWLIDELQL